MRINNVVILKDYLSTDKLQEKINQAINESASNCQDVRILETDGSLSLTAILTFGYKN